MLQAIHHTPTFPGGMFKRVQKLTTFIKPSSPYDVTAKKIKENTHKWMFDNLDILRKHYDEVMATIVKSLPSLKQVASEKAIWGIWVQGINTV